jgi:Leu/Phe-tRNA-protein transferase
MPHAILMSNTVPHASKVAERLRAHARLCRQIAEQTWSEEISQKFRRIADDCTRAAAEADGEDGRDRSIAQ